VSEPTTINPCCLDAARSIANWLAQESRDLQRNVGRLAEYPNMGNEPVARRAAALTLLALSDMVQSWLMQQRLDELSEILKAKGEI